MKRSALILFILSSLFVLFVSCSKQDIGDHSVLIRLENLTGKTIVSATFTASQSNTRVLIEYGQLEKNQVSDYIQQNDADFAAAFSILFSDGSEATVEHPWHGSDYRLQPDAGKYTYKLMTAGTSSVYTLMRRD
jgi:hypothetical protein